MTEYNKQLDSLFRFYVSEITAHANYLVGFSFALTVFSYRVIDNYIIGQHYVISLVLFDIILLFFFIGAGIWLYGRLLYYTELSNTVQKFMGLSQLEDLKIYQDLTKKEREKIRGLADIIDDSLLNRIRHRLLKQVDDDNFKVIVDINPISKKRACLITFSNLLKKEYRNILKGFIN